MDRNHNDLYHPGQLVGDGSYCTNLPDIAFNYAGTESINGRNYKLVMMLRVRPDKIRCGGGENGGDNYWVLNGTTDEIRPYRLLVKEV